MMRVIVLASQSRIAHVCRLYQRVCSLSWLWPLLAVWLFTACTSSHSELPNKVAQAAPQALTGTMLWQVRSPDNQVSHLLGTIHVDAPEVLDFSVPLSTVIADSKAVVLEVMMNEQVIAQSMQAMLLRDGRTLADHVDAETIQALQQVLQDRPMLAQAVTLMKPWAVMIALLQPEVQGLPMDMVIQQQFTAADKTVYQLETAAEQLSIFDRLSVANQVKLLQQTLNALPQLNRMHEQLITLYSNGDLAGMLALNNDYLASADEPALDELMTELLVVRNQRMVERMQLHLQQGQRLIAVGALHLAGEQGILQSLYDLGYQLTPISQ